MMNKYAVLLVSILFIAGVFWAGHELTHVYQIWESDNVRICGFKYELDITGWDLCREPGYEHESFIRESSKWEDDANRNGKYLAYAVVGIFVVADFITVKTLKKLFR